MTVSKVAPDWPPAIRLPGSTRRLEMRPAIGARTSVQSRLSSACRAAASSEATWAAASRSFARRVSNSRSVRVWLRTSGRGALHVERGDFELGLGAFDIRLGLLDRDPIGARIDDEQEIALLDDLAFLEMDGIDEAGDPGAHLDRLHRLEATGIFVPLGDGLLQRARRHD